MAVPFVRLPAPAVNSTSATPFLTVGASGAAAGDVVVVTAANPSGSAATGVADNHAGTTNVWTFYKSASVAGLTVEIWACKLTTALVSTDHITVTYGASHAVTLAALEFTGETGALTVDVSASLGNNTATDVPPLAPVTTTVAGDFVVEITSTAAIGTLDVPVPTGYTAGTSQTTTGPSAYINYVIPAGTATETNGTAQWTAATGAVGTVQVAFLATGVVASGAAAASPPLVSVPRIVIPRFRLRRPFMSGQRLAYPAVAATSTLSVTGSSGGVGGSTSTLLEGAALTGTSAGVGGSTGTLAEQGALTGTSAGVGGSSGVLAENAAITGSSGGVGGSSGVLAAADAITGTAAGAGGSSGVLTAADAHTGTGAGTGGSSGVLAAGDALTGSSAGSGGSTAALAASDLITGTSQGVGGGSGAVTVSGGSTLQVTGSSAGVGGSSGVLVAKNALSATSAGVGTSSGTLAETAFLTALSAAFGGSFGNVAVTGSAQGSGIGVKGPTGVIGGGADQLIGRAPVTVGVSGPNQSVGSGPAGSGSSNILTPGAPNQEV